ncbi:NUDIX domain-containing protein [Candidatus Pacearchaeota archaeon]|nr:NUDIX domain-containing protein [Candidatus Pacearchaeota archaeon]
MTEKVYVATKALINCDDRVLILRESEDYTDGSNKGYFDVVGGRVGFGQNIFKNLRREAKEEAGLDIEIIEPFFTDTWHPIIKGEQASVSGIFFNCYAQTDKVRLSKDHDKYLWIMPTHHKYHTLIPNLHRVFDAYIEKYLKK